MSKEKFVNVLSGLWDITKRSLGLAMIAFLPGAGVGSLPFLHSDALTGGLTSFMSMFALAMAGLGTDLASKGYFTRRDIDTRFKEAVKSGNTTDSAE